MSNIVMLFGEFSGCFGWRVEWTEQGKLKTKDFSQKEPKASQALFDAKAFKEALEVRLAAAA